VTVTVDSSSLIDYLFGNRLPALEQAIAAATLVLPPLVIAEVLSGDLTPKQREGLGDLLQDYPLHVTQLEHWMDVGALRRMLRAKGLNVTLPDAHVAQCALDLDATLLTRDDIFLHIAKHTPLRLG
jgi:predicted nucleic acid-binding protein